MWCGLRRGRASWRACLRGWSAPSRMRVRTSRKPLQHFQELLHRRGIAIVISDFYEDPETIVRTVEPLRYRGNEVVLFHILDPEEIRPDAEGLGHSGRSGDGAEN